MSTAKLTTLTTAAILLVAAVPLGIQRSAIASQQALSVSLESQNAELRQSRQLENLTAYNHVLESENNTITTTGTTTPSSPPTPPTPLVPPTGDPVLDATSFLDRVADIPSKPGPQEAQALLNQLASAPKPTLHALLDLIPARGFPSDAAVGITGMVLSRLAEQGEPTFAMEHARETDIPAPFLLSIFNTWTENDTAAAAAWLEQTITSGDIDPYFKQEATATLAAARTKNAPAAAIRAAALLDGEQRTSALIDAVANLGTEQDWLGFARHTATLEDPALREAAINGLVDGTLRNPHLTDTRHLVDQLDLPPTQLDRLIVSASTQTIDAGTPARAD